MRTLSMHPLAALLWRYSYAYTAAHDFSVCPQIMVENYVLRMGEHELQGRDEQYVPATQRQFRQFPTLGFTVHDLVLGHDRAAMHFTEHGRSTRHGGHAAWSGISLYRWDGARLTECRVEQDYYSRRRQQRTGQPHRVEGPALDPWSAPAEAPAPHAEDSVRQWLADGGLKDSPDGALDDELCAPQERMEIANPDVAVLDMFSAGPRVAFHVRLSGQYENGLVETDGCKGANATLYVVGLAIVRGGRVQLVRAVTDRLAAQRRLASVSTSARPY